VVIANSDELRAPAGADCSQTWGDKMLVKIEIDCTTQSANSATSLVNDALDKAEDQSSPSVMLVTILGDSEGTNLRDWPGSTDIQSITKWEWALRRIERTPATTIASVEHKCSALALELLLVVDRRLAAADFSLCLPLSEGSIWPSMMLFRLSRLIGDAGTRKLFFEHVTIGAAHALELDIVDEVIDISNGYSQRIDHFLSHAPLVDLAVRRRLMQDSLSMSFEDALGLHLSACEREIRRVRRDKS
jgi:isomerase DpgB